MNAKIEKCENSSFNTKKLMWLTIPIMIASTAMVIYKYVALQEISYLLLVMISVLSGSVMQSFAWHDKRKLVLFIPALFALFFLGMMIYTAI